MWTVTCNAIKYSQQKKESINVLTLYILKLFAIIILGPFYFTVALLLFFINEEVSRKLFEKYLLLILRAFEVKLEFEFEFDELDTQYCTNSILVVLNQSSFMDSIVCALIPIRPLKGIINIEMALYPTLGWFYTLTSFTIIRQWSSQAKRVLNRANNFLQAGGNILISIEGKRSRDGKINEYKKGPIVTAINNQSNIVPIIIYGANECLPFGSLWIKAGTIKLRFLKPISTQGFSYKDRNKLREQLVSIAKNEGLEFKTP